MRSGTIPEPRDIASSLASSDYCFSTVERDDRTSQPDHGRAKKDVDREVRNEQDTKDRGKDKNSESQKDDNEGKEGQNDNQKGKRSRWPLIILAVVTVAAIVGGLIYWLSTRDLEDTDDAYTEGNAVSIAPKVSDMS